MDSPPVAAPLPPVSERLRQLRPSQELLEYYRRKIEEFDAEQAEALAKLERYKTSFADEVGGVCVVWSRVFHLRGGGGLVR